MNVGGERGRLLLRRILVAGLIALGFPASGRAELKVVDVRPTYGRLGSTRPSIRVLPGEDLHVAFVVTGITRGADGRSEVSTSAELLDEAGEIVAQVPGSPARVFLALGGNTLPRHIHFSLPLDFAPGKYKVRGICTDVRTGEEIAIEQPFEVVPLEFGIVRLRLAGDPEGKIAVGGNLTVGQEVHVIGRGVGFARKGERIHVVGNLTIRDAGGKPVVPDSISFDIDQEVDDDLDQLDIRWTLPVNRAGRYSLLIEVRDEIAGVNTSYEMPLVVSAPASLEKARVNAERREPRN